jgi:PAS domain S-box-containing protein
MRNKIKEIYKTKAMKENHSNSNFFSKMLLYHPIPTAILNKDFFYEYCNEAYLDTLDLSKQLLLKKHISEQLVDCDNAEKPLSWRFVKCRNDYFNITITPIEEEENEIRYYVILSRINVETDLYKRLERNEQTFYSVYLNSKIGIVLLNDTGGVIMANNALEEFTGYSAKELRVKTVIGITYPEDISKDVEQFELLVSGQIDDYTMEKRYIRKDGKIIWGSLSVSLERDEKGQIIHVVGMVEDITEKKKHLKQIKQSEERLNLAIEGTRAGLWDWNIQNNTMDTNDWYSEMVGYAKGEEEKLKSTKEWNEVHPEDIEKSKIAIAKHFKGGNEFYEFEGRVKHKEGYWVWVLVKGKVSEWDKEGVPIRMTGTRIDISKRKEAELELQKYQSRLEEMVKERTTELEEINKELEAFAYSISHDLRTPLRHIQGFSKLLERDLKLSEDQIAFFEHIKNGASKMGNMIDALLSFSRLGRKTIEKSPVDLNILIKEVVNHLLLFYKKREINWTITNLPIVQGDVNLLEIVFVNLISNALKFSEKEEVATIEIGILSPDEGENIIFIKDNGVGFEMEFVKKLFGVFQRLHRQEEFEGIGIGLANAKRIITKHKGKIWATSTEGEGATFFVQL